MRAHLIHEHTESIYYDATKELNAAASKKARLEQTLHGYQAELDQMFKTFAKTQLVQNLSAQTLAAQNSVESANSNAVSQQAELLTLQTEITQLNDEKQKVLMQIATEREIAQAALLAHPDYPQLANKIEESEHRLQIVCAESQNLLAEVTPKLDSYAQHPVFSYLHAAKFGTCDYKPGLLSGYCDRLLAKKYGFSEMEKAFLALKHMEVTARNSQSIATEELETHSKALKDLQTTISDSVSYRTAKAALGRIESELSLCVAEELRLNGALSKYQSYCSEGHEQAIELVVRNLLVMPTEDLAQLSAATESHEDDEALSSISRLRARIIDAKRDLQFAESEYTEASLKLKRAQSLREMINNTRYSSKDYRYDNQSTIENLLLGYLVGSISADTFISKLDSQCSYMPERTRNSDIESTHSSIFNTTDSIDQSSYRTTDSF